MYLCSMYSRFPKGFAGEVRRFLFVSRCHLAWADSALNLLSLPVPSKPAGLVPGAAKRAYS